jgi:CRISPR-associated protein Cmr6
LDEQFKDSKEADVKFSPITLYTIYPGLLIGTGYPHQCGTDESIVGGFSFDYVTGLPVIPGSTLKGMLRSYIPEECKSAEDEERVAMILALLGRDELDMKRFAEAVFETNNIFIGAYPVVSEDEDMLASEFITHHKSQFENPIPLHMIKVKGGVEYRFMFVLHDYKDDDGNVISADEIKELFKQLLLLGGIGAKTNVGFGQFSDNKSEIYKVQENKKTIRVRIKEYDAEHNNAIFDLGNGKTGKLYCRNVGADKHKIHEKIKINDEYDVYSKNVKGTDKNGKEKTYINWYIEKGNASCSL